MDTEEKQKGLDEMPNVEKEGWNVKELAEQGAHEMPDETVRKILREDEGKTKGDEHDIAGSPKRNDTPQQREESKI